MTRRKSVTVVLPVFNGGAFLRESIDSVLAQTFEDFELLISDDASTDGSWGIVEAYDDPRIRAHRNRSNVGLFGNLNATIAEASSDLIRLWSQDDRMKPHCLEREQEFLRLHPEVGFFYCQRDIIDRDGRVVATAPRDPTPEVLSGLLADEISFNWGSMPGNISTVSIPVKVLKELGSFDEAMSLAADFELWVRIQGRYEVGFCRESLMELRVHDGQLSRSHGAELSFLRECREIYRRLHERLPEQTRHRRERYSRVVHCAQYVQTAARALVAGDPSYASRLLAEVHQWHHLGVVLPLWALTANLHLYRPQPVYSTHVTEDAGGEANRQRSLLT